MLTADDKKAAAREAFRGGLAAVLSAEALEVIRRAVLRDDPALVQGVTAVAAVGSCYWKPDEPAVAGCLIGLAGMRAHGCRTIGDVALFFTRTCTAADRRLGWPARRVATAHLLNAFDELPRREARALVLALVNAELARRADPAGRCHDAACAEAREGERCAAGHEQPPW